MNEEEKKNELSDMFPPLEEEKEETSQVTEESAFEPAVVETQELSLSPDLTVTDAATEEKKEEENTEVVEEETKPEEISSQPVEEPVPESLDNSDVFVASDVVNEDVTPSVEESESSVISPNYDEPSYISGVEEQKPAEEVTPVSENITPAIESSPITSEIEITPSLEIAEPIAPPVENVDAIDTIFDEAKSEEVKHKKKSIAPLIVFIILLLLIAGGVYAYLNIFKINPKKVYDKLFSSYTNEVSSTINNTIANADKSFTTTGNVSFSTNSKDLDELKNLAFNYTIGADVSQEKYVTSISYSENDKSIINAALYLLNNSVYFDSANIYEKALYINDVETDVDLSDMLKSTKLSDSAYFIEKLNSAFIASLDKASYSTRKLDIKKSKTNVSIMEINNDNINRIAKEFIAKLKNDSKFVTIGAQMSNTTEDNFKASLDQYVADEIKITPIKVSVHTKLFTNELVEIEVDYSNYKLDINKTSKNEYSIILKDNTTEMFNGTLTVVNESKVKFKTEQNSITYEIELEKIIKSDKTVVNTSVTVDDKTNYYKVDINSDITYNTEVNGIDATKSASMATLSDEEVEKISNNIDTVLNSSIIYKKLLSGYGISFSKESNSNNISPNNNTNENTNTNTNTNTSENTKKPKKEYPEECSYATCENCSGDECTCSYIDITFEKVSIVCANPNAN